MVYFVDFTLQDHRCYTSGEGVFCEIIGKQNWKNTTFFEVTFYKAGFLKFFYLLARRNCTFKQYNRLIAFHSRPFYNCLLGDLAFE